MDEEKYNFIRLDHEDDPLREGTVTRIGNNLYCDECEEKYLLGNPEVEYVGILELGDGPHRCVSCGNEIKVKIES